MARPLRIDVPGGWYHITARGQRRERIYYDARDRKECLAGEKGSRLQMQELVGDCLPAYLGPLARASDLLALSRALVRYAV